MNTPKKWRNPDGSPKTCKTDGCDSPVKVAGMCGPHYSRSRRVSEPAGPRGWFTADGVRMPCLHLGCEDPIEARGLCSTHYRQALRGLPPSDRKPRNKWFNPDGSRMTCQEDSCSEPIKTSGLCALHYDRAWKSENHVLTSWSICPIAECGRRMRLNAPMCGRCRQSRWRYGLSDEVFKEMMKPENRKCANPGCGDTDRLNIDHDHSCCPPGSFPERTRVACGGCVRGWLCHSCNVTLGQMQESPERIRGLLSYLEMSRS